MYTMDEKAWAELGSGGLGKKPGSSWAPRLQLQGSQAKSFLGYP